MNWFYYKHLERHGLGKEYVCPLEEIKSLQIFEDSKRKTTEFLTFEWC